MQMPPLDPDILRRRGEIVTALQAIVPGEGVIDDLDGMRPL
jgi:glycolate oxidase